MFLFDWPRCSGSGKISIFPLTLTIDIALTVNKVAQILDNIIPVASLPTKLRKPLGDGRSILALLLI